jgi:hypothetical protein
LAIMSRNMDTPETSRVTIIDLVHATAIQVSGMENVDPVGWMRLP